MAAFPLNLERAHKNLLTNLTELVRIDTSNPPGNETRAAQYIQHIFQREGISCKLAGPNPDRCSVLARIKGGDDPPLMLLSHLDVVPARATEWKYHPFGGVDAGGKIWGRGAMDCKNLAALWVSLMIEIKRENIPLKRDIIFAATADEEMGGEKGIKWLLENHPREMNAGFCLNEGGGWSFQVNNREYHLLNTAEKSVCWLKLTTHGTSGHASIPTSRSAILDLASILNIIGNTSLPMHLTSTAEAFIKGLAQKQPFPFSSIIKLIGNRTFSERMLKQSLGNTYEARVVRAMLRNTATPTKLKAGYKSNVIPSSASAELDGRILPGQSPDNFIKEIQELVGEEVEIEKIRSGTPSETSPQSVMSSIIREALRECRGETEVVPFLLPGATDARYLRSLGIGVYGFFPMLPGEDYHLAHGINENISIKTLDFALQVMWKVLDGYCFA